MENAFDLVVVGSGGAGLAGAVVAAAGGAKVAVLEKTAKIGGTTALSGGGVWIPCNSHVGEVGVTDSPGEALEYLRASAGSLGNEEHLLALVERGPEAITFLEDRAGVQMRAWPPVGGTIDYRPWLPGAKHGGRTLSSPETFLEPLGPWASRLRTHDRSRWQSDPLDYYRQRQHLQPPSPTAVPRYGTPSDAPLVSVASGTALIAQLLRGCLMHGVTVLTESQAKSLVTRDGRVVGVSGAHKGESFTLSAAHGVMIATGGFSHNEHLKRLWLSRPLEYSCEIQENQGDGHLMGMDSGAMLSVGDAWWMPQMAIGEADGAILAGGSREDRILPGTMIVNRRGRRFMNEAVNYYDAGESFGNKVGAAERDFPAWMIFDQSAVERYALLAWKIPSGAPTRWFKKADTIEGLAAQMEMDAAELRATVERFNRFAREGVDEDFQRGGNPWDVAWGDPENKPNPCLAPLVKGPFYAQMALTGSLGTRGGLCVTACGEVIAARTGEPIPGLYAAGNCSDGGANGAYAGAGATLGAAITFGYLIGQEIVKQKSVSAATA